MVCPVVMRDVHPAGTPLKVRGSVQPNRSGSDYLAAIRDGRHVTVSGRLIADVTGDPATAAMARRMAALLDTYGDRDDPAAGSCLWRAYGRARTREELAERGRAFEQIARGSGGLLVRSPDFLATILTAWAAAPSHFGEFGQHVVDYWEACRAGSAVLTHAISDPPGDRYLPGGAFDLAQTLRVVRRDGDGLVVRGAKMLATLAPFADDLLVYPFRPLADGESDLALCFAIPVATPGLRLYCRAALAAGDAADHPLAAGFDEMDALCVFDDVHVPWQRVFIDGNVAAANSLRPGTRMTAYGWYQSSIRSWVKAEFIFELADQCARASGRAGSATVREQLGELAGTAETFRSLVVAAQAGATPDAGGLYLCDETPLACSAMLNSRLNPRAIELLQLIVSSGLVMHPAAADEQPSAPAGDFYRQYFTGDGVDAGTHAALLRVAADLALGRFGGRQVLYERVFVGPPDAFRAKFLDQYSRTRGTEPMLKDLLS
jgi:aromatic ring hydroxylase